MTKKTEVPNIDRKSLKEYFELIKSNDVNVDHILDILDENSGVLTLTEIYKLNCLVSIKNENPEICIKSLLRLEYHLIAKIGREQEQIKAKEREQRLLEKEQRLIEAFPIHQIEKNIKFLIYSEGVIDSISIILLSFIVTNSFDSFNTENLYSHILATSIFTMIVFLVKKEIKREIKALNSTKIHYLHYETNEDNEYRNKTKLKKFALFLCSFFYVDVIFKKLNSIRLIKYLQSKVSKYNEFKVNESKTFNFRFRLFLLIIFCSSFFYFTYN